MKQGERQEVDIFESKFMPKFMSNFKSMSRSSLEIPNRF